MHNNDDRVIAAAVRARTTLARAALQGLMSRHELHEKDGWRIHEEIKGMPHGTDLVFRPVHIKHGSPDFETRVSLDHHGCPIVEADEN